MESGYKFQPSNELILRLLKEKRLNPRFSYHPIKDIDHICSLKPWDLPTESKTESEDQVFYFFYEPRYKYRNSNRVDRRTEAGQWKITSKDSQIEAGNGLTGTKKFLTFYCRGPDSKVPVKTDWGMHEYHIKNDASYKREFVVCCIKRKRNKKKKSGISTIDEGESSQQLVFPPHQSPSDRSISNGIHSEKHTPTIPPQQSQNHNSIYYPQSTTNDPPTQLSPSNGENIHTHQPLPLNHSEETTLKYPQQLPNHNSIQSLANNWVLPNYSPTQLPSDHFITAINYSGEDSATNPLPPPNSDLEWQLPLDQPNFAENNFQEQLPPIGELNAYGSSNWQNDASFSAMQTPISQEEKLMYSNSSFDNCDFSDCQIHSDEQVNHPINFPRAFPDENSRKETGQTLTPDFNLSKSDGEASAGAEDSSGRNTDYNDAWIKQLLEDFP
ncbi:NAC domain-containing protein 6-like isoform X3 [Citrus sinensis]|uniref:NAC domain-containing protein 6-like isoform X3 n=1 Tax=Citrus sinensis TaxID=2711 RepID=UPI002278FD80|nr:NAC domain-containing protein 6-like isoform X3 [Citrus sinensis]